MELGLLDLRWCKVEMLEQIIIVFSPRSLIGLCQGVLVFQFSPVLEAGVTVANLAFC
jgi:hypothetical protein